MSDDQDVLTPVYLTGFENGRESERAKIVEYLRYYGMLRNIAAKIEAKEHLK
jgi:hypothetical protein